LLLVGVLMLFRRLLLLFSVFPPETEKIDSKSNKFVAPDDEEVFCF